MKEYSIGTKCVQAGYAAGNGEPRQIPIIQSLSLIHIYHDRSVQPGLYVAGDVRTKTLRQVVTAVSDGANAATTAAEYLRDINGYKQNI